MSESARMPSCESIGCSGFGPMRRDSRWRGDKAPERKQCRKEAHGVVLCSRRLRSPTLYLTFQMFTKGTVVPRSTHAQRRCRV